MKQILEMNTAKKHHILGIVGIRFVGDGMYRLWKWEEQYGTISDTLGLEFYRITPDAGPDFLDGDGVVYVFRLPEPLARAVELEPGVDVVPGDAIHFLAPFIDAEGGYCGFENPDADILRMPLWLEALICKAIEGSEVAA